MDTFVSMTRLEMKYETEHKTQITFTYHVDSAVSLTVEKQTFFQPQKRIRNRGSNIRMIKSLQYLASGNLMFLQILIKSGNNCLAPGYLKAYLLKEFN